MPPKAIWPICYDTPSNNNAQCSQPMDMSEVQKVTANVWNMTLEGRNYIGRPGVFVDMCDVDRLFAVDQDAFLLLSYLRARNSPRSTFMATNGLAEPLGWTVKRVAAARGTLEALHYIIRVKRAWTGSPALYRWPWP